MSSPTLTLKYEVAEVATAETAESESQKRRLLSSNQLLLLCIFYSSCRQSSRRSQVSLSSFAMSAGLRQGFPTAARSLAAVGRASCPGAVRTLHALTRHVRSPITSPPSFPRRQYATPAPQVKESNLPANVYHQYSDATMEKMLESLENLLDETGETEYEVDYGSGVLTLRLGTHGTYVINKQPPNKQIWLSSPFSGPKRYDYTPEGDDWIYSRDARSLNELLNHELSEVFGRKVDLGLADVSTYAE
ncbi:hypothetical protein V8D89_008118 [Ganoderma adspersum]